MYNGAIDGIVGPKTMASLAHIDDIDAGLPKTKRITTFIQIAAGEKGIDVRPVDGLRVP